MSNTVSQVYYEQVKAQLAVAICKANDFLQKSDPITRSEKKMRNQMVNALNVLNQIYANLSKDD